MEALIENPVAALSAELCGCTVDCALSEENHTYLAIGPGGRGVVIKKLDPDCLWNGALHPSVKDRLARVRELAHPGVANLMSISREGEDAYLVWEYIEGVRFDDYLSDSAHSARALAMLARELILTVDLLHAQGIVHGALVGGNVIVTAAGAVRLTHVSPLLYTDFAVDSDCVIALLQEVTEHRGEQDSAIGKLLGAARSQHMGLRELGVRLANLGDAKVQNDAIMVQPPATPRRHALLSAALIALLGLGTAAGIWYAVQHGVGRADGRFPRSVQGIGR
jgi:serine/threonine protein kinase